MPEPAADRARTVARDAELRDAGWSSRYVFGVPGSADPPLAVRLRLPAGLELLAVAALAAAAPDTPRWVRRAAVRTRELAPGARLVTCSACVGGDAPGEVLFTLTIVHAPTFDSPAMRVPVADAAISQQVRELDDALTVVIRRPRGRASAPTAALVASYLLRTESGGLSVSFATAQERMSGAAAAMLYYDVVSTLWLGAGPPPD